MDDDVDIDEAFLQAVSQCDVPRAMMLIEAKANEGAQEPGRGDTALHLAAAAAAAAASHMHAAAGPALRRTNSGGSGASTAKAENRKAVDENAALEMIRFLVVERENPGALLRLNNQGWTPMHRAAHHRQLNALKLLLELRGDAHIHTQCGHTAAKPSCTPPRSVKASSASNSSSTRGGNTLSRTRGRALHPCSSPQPRGRGTLSGSA